MGTLTVFVSAGINNYAFQWVPSNQSALINTTSAFWLLLGDHLTGTQLGGMLVILAGVALVTWRPRTPA